MISLREFRSIERNMRDRAREYRAKCGRVDELRQFLRETVEQWQPLYPGDFEATHHANENDEAFAHRDMQRQKAFADYACHRLQPIAVGVFAVLANRPDGFKILETIGDYEASYRIYWRDPRRQSRRLPGTPWA